MTTSAPSVRHDSNAVSSPLAPSQRLPLGVLAIALVVGVVALSRSDENAIGKLGLIDALPAVYYVAVAAVVVALADAMRRRHEPTATLVVGIVALVFLVQGAASILETGARTPTAWLHSSFTELIMVTGHPAPYLDARFSWPGLFAAAATLTSVTGVGTPEFWLRWAPVAFLLAYMPPLLVIGRATLPGWRAPWLGLMAFVMFDWVGQDYFAPQAVGFFLFLVVIAVALTALRQCEPRFTSTRLQAWARTMGGPVAAAVKAVVRAGQRKFEPVEPPRSARLRIGAVAVVAALVFALVPTHQLTPALLIVVLTALAILGRLRPWPMAAFTFVAMLGWLSYAARPFWSGHLSQIFGGLGDFRGVVASGVGDRIEGSAEHLLVVRLMMLFSATIALLAILGIVRRWWVSRVVSVPLLVLLLAPGFVLVSQAYGGEGVLRLFYFALPGAALLVGALLQPRDQPMTRRGVVAVCVIMLGLFPVLLLTKWGNEAFERVSADDAALMDATVDVVPPGSTVAYLGYGGPTSYDTLTWFNTRPGLLDVRPMDTVDEVNAAIGDNPIGAYLVIEQPAVAYGVINDGLDPDFANRLEAMLLASHQYKVVLQNPAGVVLQRLTTGRKEAGPAIPPEAGEPAAHAGGGS